MITTLSSPWQERIRNAQIHAWYVWRRNRTAILAGAAVFLLAVLGGAGYWLIGMKGVGRAASAAVESAVVEGEESASPAMTPVVALAEKQQLQVVEALLLHQQDEQVATVGQLDAIQESLSQLGSALDRYQQILARVISNQQAKPRVTAPLVTGGEDALAALEDSLGPDAKSGGVTNGLLDLNAATVSQLDDLPGIGPAYAQRIVDYREENGPFKKVDELLNIKGIGEALFAKIEPLVTVGS